jgi:hypothetical protein
MRGRTFEYAIGADDKIGFGGLAVGKGELNTYVALSQIGRNRLQRLGLELSQVRPSTPWHGEPVVRHNCNAFRFCERDSLVLVLANLTPPVSRRYSPAREERDIHHCAGGPVFTAFGTRAMFTALKKLTISCVQRFTLSIYASNQAYFYG